ncbi:MAG: 16S rRNA (guanine(527)-N(7))-methyltransferase RsmG [Chitinophagaceae bacterium]|nr:16S rRNA (guanine(527)-N(7))-methyltransferase RsmG [Chitinophagaceae bacterium]
MDCILRYFPNLTETQKLQYKQLYPLYREWNEKINVISRKDIEHFYERHVLHSLSIAKFLEQRFRDNPLSGSFPKLSIADIGTGGGFPGIPLAIYFPGIQFYLADSIKKKIFVVQEIVRELGLENVSAKAIRAEKIQHKSFDFVTARAVGPLRDLWNISRLILRKEKIDNKIFPGLIALKGGDLTAELSAVKEVTEILFLNEMYREPYFDEKQLVYVYAASHVR